MECLPTNWNIRISVFDPCVVQATNAVMIGLLLSSEEQNRPASCGEISAVKRSNCVMYCNVIEHLYSAPSEETTSEALFVLSGWTEL